MTDKIFLQESTATVAYADMRRFSIISAQLGPVDVSVALRRYYEHIEESVLHHGGRIVKFMSDGVLVLFPSVSGRDHAGNGLGMLSRLAETVGPWLEENEAKGLPVMEYSVGVATGRVLHGEVGTARQRAFDLLGLPVVLAMQLAHLATVRTTPHLITGPCIQSAGGQVPSIEVEGAELAGERIRLYRLLAPRETQATGDPQAI